MEKRRDFIKKVAIGSAGLAFGGTAFGGTAFGFSAKSYKNIIGANERIRIATIGVNSRGNSMSGTIASQKMPRWHVYAMLTKELSQGLSKR